MALCGTLIAELAVSTSTGMRLICNICADDFSQTPLVGGVDYHTGIDLEFVVLALRQNLGEALFDNLEFLLRQKANFGVQRAQVTLSLMPWV